MKKFVGMLSFLISVEKPNPTIFEKKNLAKLLKCTKPWKAWYANHDHAMDHGKSRRSYQETWPPSYMAAKR